MSSASIGKAIVIDHTVPPMISSSSGEAGEGISLGPAPRAAIALARGWSAMVGEDLAAAERFSHEALLIATSAHLGLNVVDAGSSPVRAARLAGCVATQRDRIGYRSRLRPATLESILRRLRCDEPTAWAEGSTLGADQGVELARRSRGPRGRPAFGSGAWTPTERLVVDLCVTGRTNTEIAESLLISVQTVKTHLTRIYAKVNVRGRSELIARHGSERPRLP